jgi:hypothetical protein
MLTRQATVTITARDIGHHIARSLADDQAEVMEEIAETLDRYGPVNRRHQIDHLAEAMGTEGRKLINDLSAVIMGLEGGR